MAICSFYVLGIIAKLVATHVLSDQLYSGHSPLALLTVPMSVQVVVLNSKPAALDDAPHRSALELSMIIDEADQRRNPSGCGRKTSMVAWETTLEDVMEDEDAEEWEEESMMEGTVLDAGGEEENITMEEEQKVIDIIRRLCFFSCETQTVIIATTLSFLCTIKVIYSPLK